MLSADKTTPIKLAAGETDNEN